MPGEDLHSGVCPEPASAQARCGLRAPRGDSAASQPGSGSWLVEEAHESTAIIQLSPGTHKMQGGPETRLSGSEWMS